MTLNVWLLEEAMCVFLSVCTTFTPSSRFEGSTLSTSCPALARSCFFFFIAILKCYLSMVLICIFIMTDDAEHLFLCSVAICTSFWEKCLFRSFYPNFNWICFFIIELQEFFIYSFFFLYHIARGTLVPDQWSSHGSETSPLKHWTPRHIPLLYILNPTLWSDIRFAKIFSCPMGFLFTCLIVSFQTQVFFNPDEIQFFLLLLGLLGSYLRYHYLIRGHEDLFLCFLLRV